MQQLHREDLLDIIYGSGFFGSGGGGTLEEGEKILDELPPEKQCLNLISIEEVDPDPNVLSVAVAALGSPVAAQGKTFTTEAIRAVEAMGMEAKMQGKELRYIYSLEMGGGNTMLPLHVAIATGMPAIDLDANARAVPELNTGLLPIHDIPISPIALTSERGDTIVARTQDPLDSKGCEMIARQVSMIFDMGIGFSAWLVNRQQHEAASALGFITTARKVGHLLRHTAADQFPTALEAELGSENVRVYVPEGTITEIEMHTEGGFDFGVTKVQDVKGDIYSIRLQNENLVLYGPDGGALMTVPDCISIVRIDDSLPLCPLSNVETRVGQKVMVVATRTHPRWNDRGGFECWIDVLKEAGYEGPRVGFI